MSKNLKILSIFVLLLLLSGCMTKSHKENIYNKAVPIATEYMKTNYNSDVFFTRDYDINDPADSAIVLYGYLIEEEDITFSLYMNHKTYKVNFVMGPQALMDKKVNSEDVSP